MYTKNADPPTSASTSSGGHHGLLAIDGSTAGYRSVLSIPRSPVRRDNEPPDPTTTGQRARLTPGLTITTEISRCHQRHVPPHRQPQPSGPDASSAASPSSFSSGTARSRSSS